MQHRVSMIVCALAALALSTGCAAAPVPTISAGTPIGTPPAAEATVAPMPITTPPAAEATVAPMPSATPTLVAATTPVGPLPTDIPLATARAFERIFIVVFENHGAAAALSNPYFKQLAGRGAYLSNYYGVSHPSEPNYLAMLAGDPLVFDDRNYNLPQKNLVDLLGPAGVSWKAYQENYPGSCFAGGVSGNANTGLYARKHNPFISFDTIRTNPARCSLIVNVNELPGDIAAGRLPAYSFFTPNLDHDAHDLPLAVAAKWFRGFIEPKLNDPNFSRGTVLVVTFDESDIQAGAADNHIYTALLGPMIKPGSSDATRYSHYSLLRSVEDNFRLGTLNRKDAAAQPFAACNFTGGCNR